MAGGHDGLDVAANIEVTDDLHRARVEQFDQVIQDLVDRRLMEDLLIPEPVDVELQMRMVAKSGKPESGARQVNSGMVKSIS